MDDFSTDIPRQLWPGDFAARYRARGHWRGESFGYVLRARAAEHPDRIAVTAGETNLSYADLLARADRVIR